MDSSKPQPRDGLKWLLWPLNKMPNTQAESFEKSHGKKLHCDTVEYKHFQGNTEYGHPDLYRGADKSLARPTSQCIFFDGQNISFDARLVIYI